MDPIEASKRLAAYSAVDNHIVPETRVSVELSLPGGVANSYRSSELGLVRMGVVLVDCH